MATVADWLKIDGDHLTQGLHEVVEKLESANGELILDFTDVRRIDASAIKAMEELAGKANEKSVRVVLRGVNVDIYKVIKLCKLTSRFSLLS